VALATPAAAASPSWQLTDQYTGHPACYTTGGGSEYLELNLNGTWSRAGYLVAVPGVGMVVTPANRWPEKVI
jgi:hypothetical protein